METHRWLAPCPAALEDGKLGPSTEMEGEIEDSKAEILARKKKKEAERGRESCLDFVILLCLYV